MMQRIEARVSAANLRCEAGKPLQRLEVADAAIALVPQCIEMRCKAEDPRAACDVFRQMTGAGTDDEMTHAADSIVDDVITAGWERYPWNDSRSRFDDLLLTILGDDAEPASMVRCR